MQRRRDSSCSERRQSSLAHQPRAMLVHQFFEPVILAQKIQVGILVDPFQNVRRARTFERMLELHVEISGLMAGRPEPGIHDVAEILLAARAVERFEQLHAALTLTIGHRSEEHTSELQSRGLISY